MLKSIIHRLLLGRHFWRYATFDEVAELYASRLMRMFALRLVSVFTSIYLFQLGYSLLFIAFFWAGFYLMKVPFSYPAAKLIARYGPKHATLISNVISAAAMIFLPFASNPAYGLAPLVVWCVLQAFSGTLNDLAYLVDFSKVKSIEHAGKEIGYMNIIEKTATGLSPVIGGVLAFLFGPESVMVASAVLFLLSAVPLLMSAEPITTKRRLDFSGFPWRTTWRTFIAEATVGFDVYATSIVWSLFLIVAIFVSNTHEVYAEIGAVTSVTIFMALAASYGYGRLIDRRRGGELLKIGTVANSVVHLLRPLITTPMGVVLTNIINEASTTGYAMPFTRGVFDTADNSGKRIEYLFIIEMVVNFGACLAGLLFGGLLLFLTDRDSLDVFFVLAGLVTLLIMTPRFVLYRR